MIKHSDIVADMHTHTIFSQHAFSTIQENLAAAHAQGMKYMVTCDHYYNDGTDIQKKNETNRILYIDKRVNPNPYNVHVIGSMEGNLEQPITPSIISKLRSEDIKYRPIGLHSWFLPREERTCDDILMDFIEAHEKFNFNVFVHIERELDKIEHGRFGKQMHRDLQVFFMTILTYAKEHNIWIEINEASLTQDDCGNRERMQNWIVLAKDNNNPIVLGSDAHFSVEVGHFENTIEMLNSVNYPISLILNCNEEQIKHELKI